MSLHDEIMRLEMQEDRYALPYANGYSDARDDAAELACKTDAEIERLARENARLTGENAVLRDLLRACAACWSQQGIEHLRSKITAEFVRWKEVT